MNELRALCVSVRDKEVVSPAPLKARRTQRSERLRALCVSVRDKDVVSPARNLAQDTKNTEE